jgi:hypothetical protein
MKNKELKTVAVGALTYASFKLLFPKVDPYTRSFAGSLLSSALMLSENSLHRFLGLAAGIASILQILETFRGGRLVENNFKQKIYVLDEKFGVSELLPGQLPSNYIDGLTFKGMNGIFKVSDGVYIGANENGIIDYQFGLNKMLNQCIRDAGYKNITWVKLQQDSRWKALYSKSL